MPSRLDRTASCSRWKSILLSHRATTNIVISAHRSADGWLVRSRVLDAAVTSASVSHDTDGGVLLHTTGALGTSRPWSMRPIDTETLVLGERLPYPKAEHYEPALPAGDGGLITDDTFSLGRIGPDGSTETLAGRKFAGYKDARSGRLAEFGMIRALHRLADGSVLVMHDTPQGGALLRRVVIPR